MISKSHVIQTLYDQTWGRFIYAGAYDWFLRKAEKEGLAEQRRQVVSQAKGRTLEIATGTGLNLPHYPLAVTELVLTEPYPHMVALLRDKVTALKRTETTVVKAGAEALPFPDASFDTVVATMILCSAEEPRLVLKEITRVLKPGGQYLFLEHVRNPDPIVARRQDRTQPAWYLFGNGCHCNRDTGATLRESLLVIEELREGKIPKAWKIVEANIVGRARRPDLTTETMQECGCASETACASEVSRLCSDTEQLLREGHPVGTK